MKKIIKIALALTISTLLSACGDLESSTNVSPAIIEKPVVIEKSSSQSLDSTVVCCFCGMLDS